MSDSIDLNEHLFNILKAQRCFILTCCLVTKGLTNVPLEEFSSLNCLETLTDNLNEAWNMNQKFCELFSIDMPNEIEILEQAKILFPNGNNIMEQDDDWLKKQFQGEYENL
jgi:hypothetical protein